MPSIGQRDFRVEQHRVVKLKTKKPVPERLSQSNPWESFRALLEKSFVQESNSYAGQRRISPDPLQKLVLHYLPNLSAG